MKQLTALILALITLLALTGCDMIESEATTTAVVTTKTPTSTTQTTASTTTAAGAPAHEDLDFTAVTLDKVTETDKETDYVVIDVKDYGKIVIRLFPDVAPESVKNFKKLVSEKFYDGIIFHRVIEGFMIQGGDPDGNGSGGSAQTVKGEFSSNGFENNLRHVRGVVSMARTNIPNSASSQFFICHQGSPHLNGEYAAFGYVVCGMEVVDAIAKVKTNANDKPLTDVVMTTVRFAEVSG